MTKWHEILRRLSKINGQARRPVAASGGDLTSTLGGHSHTLPLPFHIPPSSFLPSILPLHSLASPSFNGVRGITQEKVLELQMSIGNF